MDGLGQLFVAQNGSVYALLPAEHNGPGHAPRQGLPALATESDVAQALLAQLLQRQQHGLSIRQQPLPLELDGAPTAELPSLGVSHRGPLPDEALQMGLSQSSLLQSLQQQGSQMLLNNLGPSHSSQPGLSRRPTSVESPSNSDSQSPPPSTRGDRSERNGHGATVSAKEKNRQAQRRFRERQKDLIANLKHRVETLQQKVNDNEKEIIALKEENAMLRGRVEGKQQGAASVTLPAEALQTLLQLPGAGSLLAEAAAAAVAAGEGGGGSGGGGFVSLGAGPRGGRGVGMGPGAGFLDFGGRNGNGGGGGGGDREYGHLGRRSQSQVHGSRSRAGDDDDPDYEGA